MYNTSPRLIHERKTWQPPFSASFKIILTRPIPASPSKKASRAKLSKTKPTGSALIVQFTAVFGQQSFGERFATFQHSSSGFDWVIGDGDKFDCSTIIDKLQARPRLDAIFFAQLYRDDHPTFCRNRDIHHMNLAFVILS